MDISSSRFNQLCSNLRRFHSGTLKVNSVLDKKATSKATNSVKCAAHHRDFLTIDPLKEKEFADVTAILLDPSCSGSGVRCKRPELEAEDSDESESERVKRLANLQAMILRHALSFPSVEVVVYSTCSVFQQVIFLVAMSLIFY